MPLFNNSQANLDNFKMQLRHARPVYWSSERLADRPSEAAQRHKMLS